MFTKIAYFGYTAYWFQNKLCLKLHLKNFWLNKLGLVQNQSLLHLFFILSYIPSELKLNFHSLILFLTFKLYFL